MNEPETAILPETAMPEPYKDRSTGLVVFGIFTILLGCLAGWLILLILFGQAMAPKNAAPPMPLSSLLFVVGLYGLLAVALVWLGIGSILARRWARALLLIFSWSWLAMGLFTLLLLVFLVPKMQAAMAAAQPPGSPALPPGAMGIMMVFLCLFFSVGFVILPAVWVLFYRSPHVKATCEARDPVARWTDACPLPVLGFCLWLAVSVPMLLIMPVAFHGVMPFFGMFLSGLPGSLLCLVLAGLWSFAARSLYKLENRGWWTILITMVVFMVSTVLTYAHHDPLDMYRVAGYPEAQIAQMQQTGLFAGNRLTWLMSLGWLPLLGWLVWIKKFLKD